MADVAASANDPIFLNHHAMVDCIFETWLQKNPNVNYPTADEIPKGHQKQDYIVPFFPLYRHKNMLLTADNFGYHCEIKSRKAELRWLSFLSLFILLVPLGILICCCCKKKCTAPSQKPKKAVNETNPLLSGSI